MRKERVQCPTTAVMPDRGRSTSLDETVRSHLETSVDHSLVPLDTDTPFQGRVHAGFHDQRRQLVGALLSAATHDDTPRELDFVDPRTKLAAKLEACCRDPVLLQESATGRLVLHQARCKSRVCPRCAEHRVHALRSKLMESMKLLDDPRLMTFTLRSSEDDLTNQIDHLVQSFRRLRQTFAWKARCKYGWYFIEITYNSRNDTWHPHLHVVADGIYFPQKTLSLTWEKCSVGSPICDIRRIPSRQILLRYVTKYVTKSQALNHAPRSRLIEWAMALRGLRMVQPFGKRPIKPIDHDESQKTKGFERITYVATLQQFAKYGCGRSRRLLKILPTLLKQNFDHPNTEYVKWLSKIHRQITARITRCVHAERIYDGKTKTIRIIKPWKQRTKPPTIRQLRLWADGKADAP